MECGHISISNNNTLLTKVIVEKHLQNTTTKAKGEDKRAARPLDTLETNILYRLFKPKVPNPLRLVLGQRTFVIRLEEVIII